MSVTDEVIERLPYIATLLDLLKSRFGAVTAKWRGSSDSLIERLPNAPSNAREIVGEVFASVVGTEVLAPIMTFGLSVAGTMVFARGFVADVWFDPDQVELALIVRFREPVVWDNFHIVEAARYAVSLKWGLRIVDAVKLVTLMALNKHVEDAVLTALQRMGLSVEKLREAVKRVREAYGKWFGNG